MRATNWLAKLLALGILGATALLGLLWLEHRTPLTLPKPTGPYAVGRTRYDWVHQEAPDELARDPHAKREVLVWLWYPAEMTAAGKPAAYQPAVWREALQSYSGPLITVLTRDPAKVVAHSYDEAELSPAEPSYPVLLMRAGLGALTTDYTTLAEDLASHGYVVVGFDAPYRTVTVVLADGRVVMRRPEDNPENLPEEAAQKLAERLLVMWCDDLRFVTDELERLNRGELGGKWTGRLDLERLGVFGHSFGGAQTAEFCREDGRCKAGVDIDGRPFGPVVEKGLDRPFLFLLSDHHGERSSPVSQEIQAQIRGIYNRLPPRAGALVTVTGTNHFSFSDQILLKSQMLLGAARFFGAGGREDPRRGLQITAALLGDFFDTYLKGQPRRTEQLLAEYRELQAEMR